jgi:valyl-tRNA synthetase
MATELAKAYDPKSVEKEIYDMWIQAGVFDAEAAAVQEAPHGATTNGGKFSIAIPPPNVTAALHLGHALNNTLQDVLIRWRRMQQLSTLWMPGTDHAGIATQTVVEKRILAEEGKRRTELDPDLAVARKKFVARTQAWKDEYERRILDQLKKIGCSCDWRRTRFTMDEVCARAVRETFFKLFADGLIYRGKRLVNWDPATQTVLADDEVEHQEVKGFFWYLKYPLEPDDRRPVAADRNGEDTATGSSRYPASGVRSTEYITVATTRPETMLGDTAVAMNPSDPRAKYLVGKMVRLPIVGRLIPIIADDHVVLPDPDSEDEKAKFSTGFLKVTPAHDPDDYAIRQRHPEIGIINILAPDGSVSDKHGWTDWAQVSKNADGSENSDLQNLIGMDRFEAREAVVEWFRTEGLLEEVRDYTHEVGHSYRSHVPIEPYLSDQWYVAVKKPIDFPGRIGVAPSQNAISDFGFRILDWKKQHADLVGERGGHAYVKGTDVPLNSLAGLALMPLLDGRIKFTPDRYANNYRAWVENLRDWPISRQLWWGHQIPVWHLLWEGPVAFAPSDSQIVKLDLPFLSSEENKHVSAQVIREGGDGRIFFAICVEPGHPRIEEQLLAIGAERDPDVLDTWFSSALWPFSTLGWPADTPDLRTFYPTDVLCTAREIITLWVTRMVMMGQYCVGDIPFHDVYIHAMIQDGEGRKMSKSLGNGIDPLEVVDSHGADAMRFTLVSMTTATQDVRMPVEEMTLPDGRKANTSPKFDVGRNFCNKLWNASRFAMMNIAGYPSWQDIRPAGHLADAWILSRLNSTIRDVTLALEGFSYSEAASTLYHFMWDDFCDWYLEIAKSRINAGEAAPKAIVAHTLDFVLRLLHPVMPFITEAIWRNLNEIAPNRGRADLPAEPILARAQWPQADAAAINADAERRFALLQEIIRQIRNVRTQHNVPPSKRLDVVIEAAGAAAEILGENTPLLKSLAMLENVSLVAPGAGQAPPDAATLTAEGAKVYVLGIVDRQAESARLQKQATMLRNGIKSIQNKLGSEGFVSKAPPAVVQKERQRLEGLEKELAAVESSLATLQ